MIKHTLAGLVGLLTASAFAVEYFVDANHGNDDWDGTSSNYVSGVKGPKKTLQAAVELADGTPTVITALPGVYDDGEATVGDHHARVAIVQPSVTLRSLGGKEVTHIVGRQSATETGIGADALRCVFVQKRDGLGDGSLVQATNIVIQGFTLRNGATRGSSGATGQGGGAYCAGLDNGGAMLIDCTVSNCVAATGGGSSRICGFRTVYADNRALLQGSAAAFGRYVSCVFVGNRAATSSPDANLGAVHQAPRIVNCVIAANDGYALGNGYTTKIYNSILLGNEKGNGYNGVNACEATDCVAASPSAFSKVTDTVTDAGVSLCVATALGDWRILAGSAAAEKTAAASALTEMTLPPGFAYTDFSGTPMPTTGTVRPGVLQDAPVAAAGGRIDFSSHAFVVDGKLAPKRTYVIPTEWPVTYKVRPVMPDGKACYCVEFSDGRGEFLIPQYDGFVRVIPPPETADAFGLVVTPARQVLYVDDVNGNDGWDGTAAAHVADTTVGPKKTLQGASDVANEKKYDYTLVRVAPGVYDEGGVESVNEGHLSSNRVWVSRTMGFVASAGAGTVTVTGAPDPDTGSFGPGAMRCCSLTGSKCYIQGFVLTGGYTQDGDKFWMKGAAAYCGGTATIFDSVLSNNTAKSIAGTYYGRLVRSRIVDNCSEAEYILSYTKLHSCVVADNKFSSGSGLSVVGYGCEPFGCTIDSGEYAAVNQNIYVYDSAIVNASHGYITAVSFGNVIAPANQFADAAAGDYRLGEWSTPVGSLSATDYARTNIYCRVVSDVDGNDLIWKDGKLTVGAVHNQPLLPMLVASGLGGGISVTGAAMGTNVVSREAEVTIEGTDVATRPFAGFLVNGELQPATVKSMTFNVSPTGESLDICAVYGTNWYVNAASGDDGNSGGTPATAKKTIRAAAALAKSGDVIHVAPGAYGAADGTMIHAKKVDEGSDPITIASRVVVQEGVGLVADEGPEKTFIVGSAAKAGDDNGLGTDAVRCLMLEKNAWVKGFTLTGGHTAAGTTGNDDNDAGAVLGRNSSDSTVRDCIVSNNVAARSGAGFKVRFVNCRIIGNKATVHSSVGRESAFVQCYIDDNYGPNVTQYHYLMDSCTFGPGNTYSDPDKNYQVVQNTGATVGAVNTIFAGPKMSANDTNYVNCVFIEGCGVKKVGPVDCIFTNLAAIALDGSGRPLAGRSVAVDRGTSARTIVKGDGTDLSGFQRVMNGVRDIGAFEADWRPLYGRDLGSKVRVSSASPAVVEGDGRTVVIPTGSLAFSVAAAGDYDLSFEVTGTGTLTVTAGDETVGSYTTGEHIVPLANLPAGVAFRLTYVPGQDDTGAAVIRGMRRRTGVLLIVR